MIRAIPTGLEQPQVPGQRRGFTRDVRLFCRTGIADGGDNLVAPARGGSSTTRSADAGTPLPDIAPDHSYAFVTGRILACVCRARRSPPPESGARRPRWDQSEESHTCIEVDDGGCWIHQFPDLIDQDFRRQPVRLPEAVHGTGEQPSVHIVQMLSVLSSMARPVGCRVRTARPAELTLTWTSVPGAQVRDKSSGTSRFADTCRQSPTATTWSLRVAWNPSLPWPSACSVIRVRQPLSRPSDTTGTSPESPDAIQGLC